MPATNKTTNFQLPQFIATDIPTWLDDINDAMLKIDTALQNIKTTGSTNESDISEIETNLQTINSNIASANGNITTLQSSVNSLNSQVTKLNNQFNLTKYNLTPQIYVYRNGQYVNATSEAEYSEVFSETNESKIPLFCSPNFKLFKITGQWYYKQPQFKEGDDLVYIGVTLPSEFIKNPEEEAHYYPNANVYQRGSGVKQPYMSSMRIEPDQNLLLFQIPDIYNEYTGNVYMFGSQSLMINTNFNLVDPNT